MEELKSLGFETTLVERDEEALTGRCDLFFTFRASIEWPLNQCLYNYNISQPVLLDALLVDLRHGKQILYDGRYENKDARTKADGCIEGLQDGNINWALSPQGKSAIAKWTTQSLRRAVLLHFQEHNLDQHLRRGHVHVFDHAPDLLARLLVGDDDDIMRDRVHRNHRVADRPVVIVLARAGAAGAAAAGVVAAAKAAKAAKASEPATATAKAAAPRSIMTEAIVQPAFLGVREHLVGLGGFLEASLGLAVAGIAIRVKFKRELAVGALQLGHIGVATDT